MYMYMYVYLHGSKTLASVWKTNNKTESALSI
ncbi:hypothetical protein BDBG_17375 [Blastomyces gilchristii SLH14081]|uniref:Uncharacterized protein n=1 Tax=Blastomyces gilchristii (strain SLH14081) TaxID=559298 RepID=A0A179UTQ7_BLAGS|nr:uncharacterized protein BDBG_17375 [Blastomyces gilchristii SLH14081]OAT10558.1 hypothetical protein BDBG_17375 [Blastomyces gilchristii SLH14081]